MRASEATSRLRRAVPDPLGAAVALAAGAIAIGYFIYNIWVGTSIFVPTGGPVFPIKVLWEILGLFALQTVFLLWHRSTPLASFIAVLATSLAAVLVLPDRNLVVGVTLLFATYNLVTRRSATVWAWAIALGAAADITLQLFLVSLPAFPVSLAAVGAIFLRSITSYLAPVLAGLVVAARQRQLQLARDFANAERLQQEAQVAATLAEERNGMARELHDVAAQYLASSLTQTEAAVRIATRDPEQAAVFLRRVQADTQLALENLREVISVLRVDVPADSPQTPLLTRLPQLIASIGSNYPGVELAVDGEVSDLSPALSLACYRIIQESLSNARKHAPGAEVHIRLERSEGELTVLVRNSPPTGRPEKRVGRAGYGLLGMRERASQLGGWLDSSATPEGGWETRAVIPLSEGLVAI